MYISIGIPFRNENVEHFRDAVRSVFAQDYQDWELVLFGDGAISELMAVAESIHDTRVTVIHSKTPVGLAGALNRIAYAARGEFLFRMDADDVMAADRVRGQLQRLTEDPAIDVLSSGAYTIDEDSRVVGATRWKALPVSQGGYLGPTPIIHPSVVARTDWFKSHPYDESFKRSQDKALWITSSVDSRIVTSREPFLFYRVSSVLTYGKYAQSCKYERRIIAQFGPEIIGVRPTQILLTKSRLRQAAFALMIAGRLGKHLAQRRHTPLDSDSMDLAQAKLDRIRAVEVPGWGETRPGH